MRSTKPQFRHYGSDIMRLQPRPLTSAGSRTVQYRTRESLVLPCSARPSGPRVSDARPGSP